MATLIYDDQSNFQFSFLGKQIQTSEIEAIKTQLTPAKPESFWATLGWVDDSPFKYEGAIQFSETGNLRSEGATGKIVSELKGIHPEIENTPLIERYINLDSTDLMNEDPSRKIRLDLFLENDEAAVVYVQHSRKTNYNDEDAEIEFILAKETIQESEKIKVQQTYEVPNILALTAEFKRTHPVVLEDFEPSSFIIKILTFKRGVGTAKKLFKESIKNITLNLGADFFEKVGEEKYNLLTFNTEGIASSEHLGGTFDQVATFNQLKKGVKTLFLIHGTFSSTTNTFRHLHSKNADGESFLQSLIRDGIYEQIIAFDHPTISADVNANITYMLENFMVGTPFSHTPVDILACSRGAIFAQAICNSPKTKHVFNIQKVISFSAANGVDYFTSAEKICDFLSVWKKIASGSFLKVILALTEYSAKFFLELPGCQQMKPGSNSLKTILNTELHQDDTRFYLFVSDWKYKNSRGWLFKRAGALVLDFGISKILGNEHDWVVGCDSQRKVPKKAVIAEIKLLDSMHCKYFDLDYTLPKTIHTDLKSIMK